MSKSCHVQLRSALLSDLRRVDGRFKSWIDPDPASGPLAMSRLKAALLPLLLAPSLALRVAPVPTTRLRPNDVQQHAPALVMRRSTAPPRMVALPMCPASGVLSLAVKAGCATVLAQLSLVAAFRSSSDPVLKQAPGFAAHKLVALALMLYAYARRTQTAD